MLPSPQSEGNPLTLPFEEQRSCEKNLKIAPLNRSVAFHHNIERACPAMARMRIANSGHPARVWRCRNPVMNGGADHTATRWRQTRIVACGPSGDDEDKPPFMRHRLCQSLIKPQMCARLGIAMKVNCPVGRGQPFRKPAIPGRIERVTRPVSGNRRSGWDWHNRLGRRRSWLYRNHKDLRCNLALQGPNGRRNPRPEVLIFEIRASACHWKAQAGKRRPLAEGSTLFRVPTCRPRAYAPLRQHPRMYRTGSRP